MAKRSEPRSNSLLLGHFELTEKQKQFRKVLENPKTRIAFLSGVAGTSKTLLSVYSALSLWNKYPELKILYLRSVVESADRGLGFLKGDIEDKFGPYMAPLLDKVDELLNDHEKELLHKKKVLQAEPINFLRGQSWRDRVVIVDECQNLTLNEIVTILTRIGKNTKIFMCGDMMQSDIKNSGFQQVTNLFDNEESEKRGIVNLKFGVEDIVRDEIISYLVKEIEKIK